MNVENVRRDFPLYERRFNGSPPIYTDSACVTLKPNQVIGAMSRYYREFPACAGRSSHALGREVSEEVKRAREAVRKFIGAGRPEEVIFTRNTTEGINLVANSLKLGNGDAVLTSDKEHNSGLVPFLLLEKKGVRHKTFQFGDLGDFEKKLTGDVKLVSTAITSNLDGTSQPAKEMAALAHGNGSLVLLDGAQAVPNRKTSVKELDADFLAFSGHKMLGPSGTGALYGKLDFLKALNPFMVGGGTVKNSTQEDFEMEDVPERFEAGLQDYAGILGLAEAVKYLQRIGMENVERHEQELNGYLSKGLAGPGMAILGDADPKSRGGVISFNIEGIHHHEVAGILHESANIMIRSGMHCAHSWFNSHSMDGSARISLYLYNTKEECDAIIEAIGKIKRLI